MVSINPHPSSVACVLQLALLVIDQLQTAPVAAFRALSTGTYMIFNALRAALRDLLMLAQLVRSAILSVQHAGIPLLRAHLAIVLASTSSFLVRDASISALRGPILTIASFYASDA
jgi:hypothetical protein